MFRYCLIVAVLASLGHGAAAGADDRETGTLRLLVKGPSGQVMPCRIHLSDANGKPVRPPGLPFWNDHFVFGGRTEFKLPVGAYRYTLERGPEFAARSGEIRIRSDGATSLQVTLERIANMAADSWWSGDLHVHRPPEDMKLLLRAEDLHIAPVITWWNQRNLWAGRDVPKNPLVRFDQHRYYHLMAGEDERAGGALLYFNLNRPLDIAASSREFPSPMAFVRAAREKDPNVWIDIEKPFWWDVPVWAALGNVDSIGLANNHMCRSRMYESEAWGRPRDTERAARTPG